jgi:hypothetical protein
VQVEDCVECELEVGLELHGPVLIVHWLRRPGTVCGVSRVRRRCVRGVCGTNKRRRRGVDREPARGARCRARSSIGYSGIVCPLAWRNASSCSSSCA